MAADASTSYRNVKPIKDSDSEIESDEDTPLWRQKQERYLRKKQGPGTTTSPGSSAAEMQSNVSRMQQKRKNNVWGSVLQEQDLTQTLVKSGVDSQEGIDLSRDVESYNFTNRYLDSRPDLDEEDLPSDEQPKPAVTANPGSAIRSVIGYDDTLDSKKPDARRGKKRKAEEERPKTGGVFDRLGAKKLTTTHLGDIGVDESMDAKVVVQKMADFLHEPKVELIERVVEQLGKAVAIRILKATKDVEEGGGMYTVDGSRRRTPGGVYFQLMKQQPEFTPEIKKIVFKEDIEEFKNKQKKEKRKQKRKAEYQRKKFQKENARSSNNDQSRSRSSSYSRSRSPKSIVENQEEEMDDGQEKCKPEKSRDSYTAKPDGHSRKSRRRYKNKYTDFDKQENDKNSGSDSDGAYSSRHSAGSKPLSFEEELEAMKKQIQERSRSLNAGKMEDESMEKEVASDGKDTSMGDLAAEESSVVDVLIE